MLQAQAVSIGLHQLLLNCVADTHALLALKAFQPSHPAPSAAIAQTAPTAQEAPMAVATAAHGARVHTTGMPWGRSKKRPPKQNRARGPPKDTQCVVKAEATMHAILDYKGAGLSMSFYSV